MKKLIATLLCLTLLISAMTFTWVSADETETTEPAEYKIRFIKPNTSGKPHPTFETKGGWMEGSQFKYDDGKYYTTIKLMDRYSNILYMQFNFLKGNLKYQNVSSNHEWVKPAYYDIYFYHPAFNSNDDENAKVEVYHNGETTTLKMNQKTNKSQAWNLVSDADTPLYFSGSGDEYIKISASKGATFLSVGCIKIVENLDYTPEEPVDAPEEVATEKPLISDVKCENGKITLITNGSTIDKNRTIYAIVAAYENGILAGMKTNTITIKAGSTDTLTALNMPSSKSAKYELFIINEKIEAYEY